MLRSHTDGRTDHTRVHNLTT